MITIRQGQVKDIETIVEFQAAMAAETEDLSLDKDTVRKGVRAVFEDSSPERDALRQKGTYYIAEDDGGIQGVLLTIPEWSDWRNKTILWIHSLYVIPKYRKKGVFRKLFQFLKEKVESSPELAGLRLYVDKKNRVAHKVYEKIGMNKDHYEMYEWIK